jgi:hypothetical protein
MPATTTEVGVKLNKRTVNKDAKTQLKELEEESVLLTSDDLLEMKRDALETRMNVKKSRKRKRDESDKPEKAAKKAKKADPIKAKNIAVKKAIKYLGCEVNQEISVRDVKAFIDPFDGFHHKLKVGIPVYGTKDLVMVGTFRIPSNAMAYIKNKIMVAEEENAIAAKGINVSEEDEASIKKQVAHNKVLIKTLKQYYADCYKVYYDGYARNESVIDKKVEKMLEKPVKISCKTLSDKEKETFKCELAVNCF